LFHCAYISQVQFRAFKSQRIVFKSVVLPVQFAQIIPILSVFKTSISSGIVINFSEYQTSIFLSFIIISGNLIVVEILINLAFWSFSGSVNLTSLSSIFILD